MSNIRTETTYGEYSSKFQAYVVWVDHNSTLEDKQKEGTIAGISPQTGRNLHLGVFKLNGNGAGIVLNVLVPVGRLGEFNLPKLGDVIWIEESRRSIGSPPVYLYSTYNSMVGADKMYGYNPVPQWGSMPGDSGVVESYRDHIKQFVPTINSNFIRKYIKSITGFRFRNFYRGNLVSGRFAVRGDSVFDIDGSVSKPYLVENGAYIGYGGDLETDQSNYPNPLNVPAEKEEDTDYTYYNLLYEPIDTAISGDQYKNEGGMAAYTPQKEKNILNNKNYMSYQPVMDKDYLEKAEFERELPAAEEYQVAIRGNNKLLIQDQYGDGEQLLITLKNQNDAGITIMHNAEKGQVRIRDSMGQGMLLEANPEAPRVILWTANRQVIEQGAVTGVGEFTYIRNGAKFGDSETSFGTKTGLTKDDVSNQEFLMVSTPDIIGELSGRLSSGMNSLVGGAGSPGIYFRNNVDPDSTGQSMSIYKTGTDMTLALGQTNSGFDGAVQSSSLTQTLTGDEVIQVNTLHHVTPGVEHQYLESTTISGSEATKTTLLERTGSDTISTLDTITGDNTAISTKTLLLKNNNQITYTSNGATPNVNINLKAGGNNVADYDMTGTDIVTTKYDAGAALHTISQTNSGITVARALDGLSLPINVGVDNGTGTLSLGNSKGITTIAGLSVDITSASTTEITAATTVDIAGVTVDVAATGDLTLAGSSVAINEL